MAKNCSFWRTQLQPLDADNQLTHRVARQLFTMAQVPPSASSRVSSNPREDIAHERHGARTRPHVLVVAGSLTTKPFGFPLTRELSSALLHRLVAVASEEDWLVVAGAKFPTSTEIRRFLREFYEAHFLDDNFERWFGHLETTYANNVVRGRHEAHADERSLALYAAMHAVLDEVLHRIDDQSQRYRKQHPELVSLQTAFFERLAERADLTVVNLNYDDVLFDALGGTAALMGFVQANDGTSPSDETFSPSDSFLSTQRTRLLHLHGHYRLLPDGGASKCTPRNAPTRWLRAHPGQYEAGTERMRPLFPIVSGNEKPWALSGRPFATYQALATIAAHQADALLVIGYGGGDGHVNELLRIGVDGKHTVGFQIDPVCSPLGWNAPNHFVKVEKGYDAFLQSAALTSQVLDTLAPIAPAT